MHQVFIIVHVLFLFTIELIVAGASSDDSDQVGLHLNWQHLKTLSYNYLSQVNYKKIKCSISISIISYVMIAPMLTLLLSFSSKSEYSWFCMFCLLASAAALSPILPQTSKPLEFFYSHSRRILTLVTVKAIMCRDLKTVQFIIYHKIAGKYQVTAPWSRIWSSSVSRGMAGFYLKIMIHRR